MNLISILSAPLKKIYGANKSENNKQRPWSMTISRSGITYKVMKYVYGDEDSIPNFVKNNGCPWVMVSTFFMLVFPLIWLGKLISKGVNALHSFKLFSNGQEPTNEDIQNWVDNHKVTLQDIIDNWWTSDHHNAMSYFKSQSVLLLGLGDEEVGDIYKSENYDIYWNIRRNSWLRGNSLISLYVRQNPDTYIKDLASMEQPNFEDTIEGKKVAESDRIWDLKMEAVKLKRKKADEFAMKIIKIWQFITPVLLVVLYTAVISLIVLLVIVLPNIWGWVVGILSSWSWSVFLEVLKDLVVICGVGVLLIVLINFVEPLFKHPKMAPVCKVLSWIVIGIVAPFILLWNIGAGLVNIIGMAAKSECPVNKFED
jgi:hypothetical protein